jgi:hypothetical protein
MITPEQHAEIRRLYYGEHWKVGTIAAALGVHHETVRAAIAHDTQAVRRGMCRATKLDRTCRSRGLRPRAPSDLTRRRRTRALATADAAVRHKPSATDAAGPLREHPQMLVSTAGKSEWSTSGEQPWVNFGER